VYFPISIFCAWATVATLVSLTNVLIAAGNIAMSVSNQSTVEGLIYAVICGLLICCLIYFSDANSPYTIVYIWGYCWIAVANWKSYFDISVTAITFVVMFLATAGSIIVYRLYYDPESSSMYSSRASYRPVDE